MTGLLSLRLCSGFVDQKAANHVFNDHVQLLMADFPLKSICSIDTAFMPLYGQQFRKTDTVF